MKQMRERKEATVGLALIPIISLMVALIVGMKFWGADPHLPILFGGIVAGLVAMFGLGIPWAELEEGIAETIKMSMGAILILMIIGMIIGTWILAGIVPTMIYWGLKLLSPSIFLVATLLLCSVVSLATGSSWTTAGTVGIALVGVGAGLGMPVGMVGGAIISGAYFGDKMSPLSDTTNLAPAVAGSELFEHIKHMTFTTGPSYLIALVVYGILGIKYAGNTVDTSAINVILDGLSASFNLNPILLLAPVMVILMVVLKIPAIPGLIAGTFLGGFFAWIFQGAGMSAIIGAAHYGFESATGIEALDNLLSRGGLDGMMWTVSLIMIALTFGGIMEKSGLLHALAASLLRFAKSTGSVVLFTILTVIAMNILAGDQYLAIVIPGRMYKEVFKERGLKAKNLSRVLEDSGTLTSVLVPWNSCGLYMSSTLGIATLTYAPYAILNWLNPLISIFYGYTGITMEKLDEEEVVA